MKLPEWLKIDRELGGTDAYGHVFRVFDSRVDAQRPVARIARILDDPGGSSPWRKPLLDRALELLSTSLPYVSTLRDIGISDAAVFLVHDEHPISLASRIQADEGLQPAMVLRITEQLLVGLAALHQRGIAHGDLRAGNVFLSEVPTAGKFAGNVWIGDVVTGGLPYWSEGRFLPAMASCFPPEWNGKIAAPSPKADLYALGVLIGEMLLGREAIRSVSESAQESSVSLLKAIAPRLNRFKASSHGRELIFLLTRLLDAEDERPVNSAAALKQQNGRRHRKTLVLWAVFLAAACCSTAGLTTALTRSRKAVDEQKAQLTSLVAEKTKVEGKNVELAGKNSDLEREIKRLTGDPPVGTDKAQIAWQAAITPPSKTFPDDFRRITKKIESLPLADPIRAQLCEWLKDYQALYDDAKRWRQSEPELKAMLVQFGNAPWDRTITSDAMTHLNSLTEAERIWHEWAYKRPDDANLDLLIPGHDPKVGKILRKWLDAINGKNNWTLWLIDGNAPEGFGTRRVVLIDASNSWTWPYKLDHNWVDATQHTYNDTDERSIAFDWKRGSPITVAVAYDWSVWAAGTTWKYLIEKKKISGPLAIWRLHVESPLSEGEASFNYKIDNCPGPPRPPLGAAIRAAATNGSGNAPS